MKASRFSDAQKAFYFEAGFRWNAGGGYLPEGRDQPCDVIQLEEKKYDG
jgi:hypothetical protein